MAHFNGATTDLAVIGLLEGATSILLRNDDWGSPGT
jgi:hypothetical protein